MCRTKRAGGDAEGNPAWRYEHMFAKMGTPDGTCPEGRRSTIMAKNTGRGFRRGEVRGRSQLPNPKTDGFTKRDTETGEFMAGKDGKPFKGVRKEKGK